MRNIMNGCKCIDKPGSRRCFVPCEAQRRFYKDFNQSDMNNDKDYWIAKILELGMPLAVMQYQQQFLPAPSPEAKEENGWVSVKDRLPENSNNVLAWCDGRLHVMSYFQVENGYRLWANCYDDISGDGELDDQYSPTHWQPLPAPPKV